MIAQLENIGKIYKSLDKTTGQVFEKAALKNVSIKISNGEIHSILGENGAGKSTLVNIFSGLILPTSGKIKIDNQIVSFSSPRYAVTSGVSIVHQRCRLAENATVFENIIMGNSLNKKKTFF